MDMFFRFTISFSINEVINRKGELLKSFSEDENMEWTLIVIVLLILIIAYLNWY